MAVRVAMKRLLLILSIGLALPGVAKAGTVVTPNVTMVSRDVPAGGRSLQAAAAPIRFDMLGLHWQGAGSVAYRTPKRRVIRAPQHCDGSSVASGPEHEIEHTLEIIG